MKILSKENPLLTKVIVLLLVTAALYFVVTLLVQMQLKNLQDKITLQISTQQQLLISIADLTAKNGADAVTEAIVRDCSVAERTDFDDLLGRLDKGLSNSDLTKLERLFGRCGSFFAERKALMALRLGREIEVYRGYVNQLEEVSNVNVSEKYQLTAWEQLATDERKQSELFSSLVVTQDKIISTLLSGKSATSEDIKTILEEARENQEMLIFTNKQAAQTRMLLKPQ
jgi:hypothetical protein